MTVRRRLGRPTFRRAAAGLALAVLVALLWTAPGPFPKDARDAAEDPLRELYVERGRQWLLAGDWPRALAYLSAAYRGAEEDEGLRFLVARAAAPLRAMPAEAVGYAGGDGLPRRRRLKLDASRGPWKNAGLSPGWTRIAVVEAGGGAGIFNADDSDWRTDSKYFPDRLAVTEIAAVRFSPDGGKVAGLSTSDEAPYRPDGEHLPGQLAVDHVVLWQYDSWDVEWSWTGEPQPRPPADDGASATIAFSADGRRLIAVSPAGVGRIFDTATGALQATFDTGPATAVALRPDGLRLVTAGERGAMIRNAQSGQPIVSLDLPPRAAVHSLAYSPDGRLVVAAGELPEVRLFDADDGELAAILSGHRGNVRRAVFSAGGDLVLTAGDDRTARLWDTRRGWQLGAWPLPAAEVLDADFDRRSRRFATVHADGALFIEPLPPLDRAGAAEIDRLLACFVPWRLASGQLVPATPDPRACAKIRPYETPPPRLAAAPVPTPTRLSGLPAAAAGSAAMSLRLRNADLVETLRSFAVLLDLDLLVAPGVRGTVDAELVDVDPERAWRELLRAHDLVAEAAGYLILIVPEDWPEMVPPAAVFHPSPPDGWPGELKEILRQLPFPIRGFRPPPQPTDPGLGWALTSQDIFLFEAEPATLDFGDPAPWPGEWIDMSLRDADLVETLRSFSLIADSELTIDPDVSGTVTAEVCGFPWDRVLVDVLRLHDLRLEIYGNRWRVRRREHQP